MSVRPMTHGERGVVQPGPCVPFLLTLILVALSATSVLNASLSTEPVWFYPMTDLQNHTVGPSHPVSSASDGGWVNITNKGNASDYPDHVTGGQEYRFNVSVTFEVPPNETATLSIFDGPCLVIDPSPVRDFGCLPFPPFSMDIGSGTHVLAQSFNASTPPVHREYVGSLVILAALSTGGTDYFSTALKLLPVDLASDVVLLATAVGVHCLCNAVLASIDEVFEDPTGLLRPGAQVVVWSDGIFGRVVLRDILEIRGDLYPTEYPNIVAWKSYHEIVRTGNRNHGPVLTDPSATPIEAIASTKFVLSVRYSDLDGDSPDLFLVLDGKRMETDPTNGQTGPTGTFAVTVDLSPGMHNYSFLADDGIGAANSTTATETMTIVVIAPVLVYFAVFVPGPTVSVLAFVWWRKRRRQKTLLLGEPDIGSAQLPVGPRRPGS